MKEKLLELERELRRLVAMDEESAAVVELDQAKVGRLSRVDAMRAQAMAKEARARREQMLRRVTAALRRFDAGDFGFCLGCGEDIDPRRLDIDPAAEHCIRCASANER